MRLNEDPAFSEQYELVMGRLMSIPDEGFSCEPLRGYFKTLSVYVSNIYDFIRFKKNGTYKNADIGVLKKWNGILYGDLLNGAYKNSPANPEYMASLLPEEHKGSAALFAAIAAQVYAMTVYAYEERLEEILASAELLGELYSACIEGIPSYDEVKDILYWFVWDYLNLFTEHKIASQVDPESNFFAELFKKAAETKDARYLYYTGEYISEENTGLFEHVCSLPEETVDKIAETFTEGFRRGFDLTGKSLKGKSTVQIRCPIGMERIIVRSMERFGEMGLSAAMYRNPVGIHERTEALEDGVYGMLPDKQYQFDHRQDMALVIDSKLVSRRLEVMRRVFAKYADKAKRLAGPAVMESFGSLPFYPENNKWAARYNEKTNKLKLKYESKARDITNEFIDPKTRSYTIISFPDPSIGPDFKEIFDEIIKINTLDNDEYSRIQQNIIDVLDQGEYVRIKGCSGNCTDITVALNHLEDPAKQTNFENCVADVNIPVGEVFTSPKLKGTNGRLFVSEVFLEGLKYTDLDISFRDGVVSSYNCSNFEDPEENRQYIKENILAGHDTLPMGEFAIGTNTLAYSVCRKYEISDRLDILIAEKTGPHFALGDTCYSFEEDLESFNPDGKAIVARENDFSRLRKTEPEKAYFNQHIDITIPYDELGSLSVLCNDGREIPVISDGRYVLAGTEELNTYL